MNDPARAQSAVLGDVMRIEDYAQTRSHIFPSEPSFRWFLRLHRARFVEAGALLQLTGRNYVRPALADELVASIGVEEAQASRKGRGAA